jgi:hypothetical protein
MQDLTSADGKEVFILTDSVSLLESKGKFSTVDNPYIHKQLWPLLSAHFVKLTMISISGCQTKDILREVEKLVQAKAGGNPAAFDHVLILMPTLFRLNELSVTAGTTIEKQKPEHKEVVKKLGETLKPMEYKMVIGPGNAEEWKTTGNVSFDKMAAELHSEFSKNDIPVISGMPLHRQLDIDQFHFTA